MFSGCSSLKSLPDISKWETNNIKYMDDLFINCLSLEFLPDISKWNTKNVINMRRLFYNCASLKAIPDISKWNIKYVIDIDYMLYGCISLITLPNISKWKIKNFNLDNIFESSSISISFKASDLTSSFQSGIENKNYEKLKYADSSLNSKDFINEMKYTNFSNIETNDDELNDYYENFFG